MLRRILTLTVLLTALPAAAAPREDFDRLVREVQAAPQDAALRERVIAAARALKPPPALPEAAERHLARGEAAIERAKSPADFVLAVREFEQATRAAPWHAAAYFNLGVAQEKAGQPKDAIGSFKLYLLAAPGASDAAAVKKRLYKLEFDAEQATAVAPDAKPKSALTDLLGTWVYREGDPADLVRDLFFRAEGDGVDSLRLTYSHQVVVANPAGWPAAYTAPPFRRGVLRIRLRAHELSGNFELDYGDSCKRPNDSDRLEGHLATDRKRMVIDLRRNVYGFTAGCSIVESKRNDRWNLRKAD